MKLNVLYEDNHLIAVLKPAGILTQSDKTGDISLMDIVKSYLKKKYQKSGNVFLGLLHRLDRPVSGIILFAKTSKGASRLSEQFRNKEIKKTYHAIVINKPEKEKGTLVNYLEKNKKISPAELSYEIAVSSKKYSLLKINLKTGRFHQIRKQLSLLGSPILGDVKYGAPFALPNKSIALTATSISFKTATTKENKEISISLPKEWKKYGFR